MQGTSAVCYTRTPAFNLNHWRNVVAAISASLARNTGQFYGRCDFVAVKTESCRQDNFGQVRDSRCCQEQLLVTAHKYLTRVIITFMELFAKTAFKSTNLKLSY